MNNPPYWTNPNDPNDPHSQDTVAGQYPTFPQPNQPSQFPSSPGQYSQNAPNFPQNSGQYTQNVHSGQFNQPPLPTISQQLTKPTLKQRFRGMPRWKRFGTIGCATLVGAVLLCSFCAIVGNALPKAPQQSVATQPSPAPTHQTRPTATPKPKPSPTPVPSPTPTTAPVPTPEPTQPPAPANQPVQQPVQQAPPPAAPPTGVNGNPWGYDFNPGNYIYSPNSGFCGYFSCISNFWNGNGYVEECNDGMYGKSGGIQGSCSHHGGNMRPLYSH